MKSPPLPLLPYMKVIETFLLHFRMKPYENQMLLRIWYLLGNIRNINMIGIKKISISNSYIYTIKINRMVFIENSEFWAYLSLTKYSVWLQTNNGMYL